MNRARRCLASVIKPTPMWQRRIPFKCTYPGNVTRLHQRFYNVRITLGSVNAFFIAFAYHNQKKTNEGSLDIPPKNIPI